MEDRLHQSPILCFFLDLVTKLSRVSAGAALLDFALRSREIFHQLLTRSDMVRHEAETLGAGINNYHMLSTIFLRSVALHARPIVHVVGAIPR